MRGQVSLFEYFFGIKILSDLWAEQRKTDLRRVEMELEEADEMVCVQLALNSALQLLRLCKRRCLKWKLNCKETPNH